MNNKETKWVEKEYKEYKRFGFSGIHIISPQIFDLFPPSKSFNIIQWYLQVGSKRVINTFDHTESYWFDIGTVEKLKQAEEYLITKSLN